MPEANHFRDQSSPGGHHSPDRGQVLVARPPLSACEGRSLYKAQDKLKNDTGCAGAYESAEEADAARRNSSRTPGSSYPTIQPCLSKHSGQPLLVWALSLSSGLCRQRRDWPGAPFGAAYLIQAVELGVLLGRDS